VALETILHASSRSAVRASRNATIVEVDDLADRFDPQRVESPARPRGSSAHNSQYALISGPSLDALAEGSELAFNDLSDIENDPRFNNADRLAVRAARIRACAFIPLSVENRWLGWIAIGCHQPHVFLLDEIGLYHSLADEMAIVLGDETFLAQLPRR
jgi:hypothetical protein